MRACQPLSDGYVERDGIKIFYEVFGAGEPTILLLPTWSLIHSRQWKMQVPYLARHCRVITFDGRGNGRSDRPVDPEAYAGERVCGRCDRGDGRDADRTRDHRQLLVGRTARALARRKPSAAGRCSGLRRPDVHGGRTPPAGANGVLVGRRARHRRGLGEVQQALLAAGLPGLCRFLPVDNVPRTALDQANRGRRWLGPGNHGRDAGAHTRGPRRWRDT